MFCQKYKRHTLQIFLFQQPLNTWNWKNKNKKQTNQKKNDNKKGKHQFADGIFDCIFLIQSFRILIQISPKCVHVNTN